MKKNEMKDSDFLLKNKRKDNFIFSSYLLRSFLYAMFCTTFPSDYIFQMR